VKSPLVIYHGNCLDGFTAAWVMRGWLEYTGIEPHAVEPTQYYPAQYAPQGQRVTLPDVTGRKVWMVDFCTGRDQLLELKAAAADLVVLDHHKTAQSACEGLDFCTFDMDRSGAMLAWDYCYPGQSPSWLVQYVQDRDLWRFMLPHSREINAFLQSRAMTFDAWDSLAGHWEPTRDMRLLGTGALNHLQQYVSEVSRQARVGRFAGYPHAPIVNAAYVGISELLNELAKGAEFAVGWFQNSSGTYTYSLRSRGDFDVSALAQRFGGGGHKNAAGFTVSERIEEDPKP